MAKIRMQTHHLKKGMRILVDVYTGFGVVIVPAGTVVTRNVLELLTKHFIEDVVVEYIPEELALLAGLLHDIGHLKYSNLQQEKDILHNELMKNFNEKHSMYRYKMLQRKQLDFHVKQAVLTHHERLDGSGFPLGVTFENINSIARILAITDTYATLTAAEPGGQTMQIFEVLNYMQEQEFRKYDSAYLRIFMEHIAQSLIQQEVLLSNGQTGKVLMINKLDVTRPLLKVDEQYIRITKLVEGESCNDSST